MTAYEQLGVSRSATPAVIREAYLRLVKLCHPDLHPGDSAAAERFRLVQEAYDILGDEQRRRLYDQNGNAALPVFGEWAVTGTLAKGDLADLYTAASTQSGVKAVLKIVQAPQDNDLIRAEQAALTALEAFEPDHEFHRYIPRRLASFEASGRRANVLSLAEPDSRSLADIQTYFPRGLPFGHIVWMMNRGLTALGFVSRAGIVHGAVVPEHLLFGVKSHGLLLVDWCYSVIYESARTIPARVKARVALYPAEVSRKERPDASTDVYMLAASLLQAAESPVPRRFRPWFDLAMAASPHSRKRDPWEMQDRWKELAHQEYGPPQYQELILKETP